MNNRDLTHTWVRVHTRFFRWILEHLDETYADDAGEYITSMDIDIQISLMSLMGVPIAGFVKAPGNDGCWQVLILAGGLSDITYIQEKDLILGKSNNCN